LAGSGTLLETQLSVGSLNATAYAIKIPNGGLNLVLVNKDPLQSLSLNIQTSRSIRTASLQTMTAASLAATSGVTIQGATVNSEGSFAPASPARLTTSENGTTCDLPALSAGLITIA
jgi:hypothetical protein